jgi:hypothetical protein
MSLSEDLVCFLMALPLAYQRKESLTLDWVKDGSVSWMRVLRVVQGEALDARLSLLKQRL